MKLYSSIAVAALAIGLVSSGYAIQETTVVKSKTFTATPQGVVTNKNVRVYSTPNSNSRGVFMHSNGNYRGGNYVGPQKQTTILQKNHMFRGGQLTKVKKCTGGVCRTVWIQKRI